MMRIKVPYSKSIISFAFILFIFFIFFPKSLPFQPPMQEQGKEKLGEGNIINQVINLTIFILSALAATEKFDKIISFVKKEKYLSIFLFWCFLTMIWSDLPLMTFKRWFQMFTFYLVIITFLTYFDEEKLIKTLKPIAYLYVLVTLISILIIPEAKDPEFNTWRGLAPTKNSLGQAGVFLSVLTLIFYNYQSLKVKKYIALSFFLLSVTITLGTFSSTSYSALFVFLFGTFLFYIKNKLFNQLGVGNFLFFFLLTTLFFLVLIIFYYIPNITDLIQGIFGKDETFYDRGKLWKVMLWEISKHPILGCGYQSFWTIENPKLQAIYQTFLWLPNQAHNGYLDIINEVGIIGLFLFLLMIFQFFRKSIKYNQLNLWGWLLILPLVSNITESNFFRIGPVTPLFIMLGYLTNMKKIYKQ